MEQIVIQINDKKKAQALMNFLKALDFIENITASDLSALKPKSKTASEQDFFSMAGVWADRDVTLESIRKKAWPSRV
jgi:hypothetical protein